MRFDLIPWAHLRSLTLFEAASLIAGVDPNSEQIDSMAASRCKVFQRAIVEAVQRADEYAWEYARDLELQRINGRVEDYENARITSDIWEITGSYEDYLPSIEIRKSVAAVLTDPENAPILLPIDPWYTATVYAGEMNDWLERNEIASDYKFADSQKVIVTSVEDNWNSRQSKAAPNLVSSEVTQGHLKDTWMDKPLSTRERNTLLAIISSLCKNGGIDTDRPAKAAGIIKSILAGHGVQIGESTIELHLKRIPEALEARSR